MSSETAITLGPSVSGYLLFFSSVLALTHVIVLFPVMVYQEGNWIHSDKLD